MKKEKNKDEIIEESQEKIDELKAQVQELENKQKELIEEREKEKEEEKKETKKEEESKEDKEISIEKVGEEKKKGRGVIWLIIILAIVGVILFWLNRDIPLTIKYNDGTEDVRITLKFFSRIDKKLVKEIPTLAGYTFVGYFETYELTEEEKTSIQNDANKVNTICKEGFRLNDDKNKCIAKEEFEFDKRRIFDEMTIEALWSNISFEIDPTSRTVYEGDGFKITAMVTGTDNKTVTWSSKDTAIATVNSEGHVVGQKEGSTVIIAENNGIRKECSVKVEKKPVKDEGTVSLSMSNQCMIGYETIVVKANVSSNAINKTVNWTYPKCYDYTSEGDNSIRLSRNDSCGDTEELNPVVSVKLNNGNSDSVKFIYEKILEAGVYYSNGTKVPLVDGVYKGAGFEIKSNIPATITAVGYNGSSNVASSTATSAKLYDAADSTVTVKTACGQTKTFKTVAVIN